MYKRRGFPLGLLFASGLGIAGTAFGQDFFRELGTSRSSGGLGPVVPSEYSLPAGSPSGMRRVTPLTDTEEDSKYNVAIGPVRMSIAAGVGVEWNDNIFYSENHRESDFVLRPLLNLDVFWPFGDTNALRLTLGASYAKYFDHDELDSGSLMFSPNSVLAFSFDVVNLKFTVRDRFSYQEDPYEIAPLSNVARYQRYENQAGIEMEWPINEKLTFTAGYDHYNLWATGDVFSSEDRSIDTLFIRPSYQLTPAVKIGLFASDSIVDFDADDRADSNGIMVGPFIDVQLTDVITLYLEAGYQGLNFDGESSFDDDFFVRANEDFFESLTEDERALFRDSSDANSFYVKFELAHRPSEIFEHGISFTKTAEIGFGSNFYDLYHVEYGATFKGIRNTELTGILFYEFYDTSGDFSEEADRFGASIGIRHHLTDSIAIGLDYRFLLKDSNIEGADYYQNLVFLSLYYRF
jgi:opacity protein-like surface antigen